MKRKILSLVALLTALCLFSGCGVTDALLDLIPDSTERQSPSLMVQRIDVAIYPADPEFERHYETQENLNAALTLLRDLVTTDVPEEEPRLDDGQTYYTITATYSGGKQQNYYLLSYRYLKVGDDPWCEISFDSAMGFTKFLREHQSDDGSYTPPATEPPAETTLPTETGTVPTDASAQNA